MLTHLSAYSSVLQSDYQKNENYNVFYGGLEEELHV